ncbi:ABC transporter ATP-binding protein/permease [Pseudonocardia sp. DSM 110487]|uniref:ABC transporter ATP-binding protein n=1 Tax=Pseudonocardia sp. DSM 110487 TaxID=2865833 RepID=UPI001C6A3011|nr:ABC transporter ATP-binding protein [Pseudonocardia sp. DSM 110487]QYN33584.1 ABC transporter ATP-binding protein/permease [Pseudonocardia sp. DSM 110487]
MSLGSLFRSRVGMKAGPGPVLIGSDDLKTPYWAIGYGAGSASVSGLIGSAPRSLLGVAQHAWNAAPGLTATCVVLQVVAGCLQALGLLSTVQVFTRLLEAGPNAERLEAALPSIIFVAIAIACRGILTAAAGMVQAYIGPIVEKQAEDALYAALIEADIVAFDDPDFTHLVARVVQRSAGQFRQAVRLSSDLSGSIILVFSTILTAGLLHPILVPITLVSALPQAWASVRSAQLGFESWIKLNSESRRSNVASDLISNRRNVAEVRAYGAQDVVLGDYRAISHSAMTEGIRVGLRQSRVRGAGRLLSALSSVVGFSTIGVLVYAGQLQLGLAGAAILALRMAASMISVAVSTLGQLFECGVTVDLYRSCLNDMRSRRRGVTGKLPAAPSRIELSDIIFRYPGQERPAVNGVSITLTRGAVVALVGENGSGKSTLAKLISGLYLPAAGTVKWDGIDISSIDPRDLHRYVAVIMQNPLRWPATAENNIRIGRFDRADPTDAALHDAACRSGSDSVVSTLPSGYSSILSPQFQSGLELSGGQWQRFGVARGLYRDAPVVVADEPTAALDARAERDVFRALRESGSSENITVLVTHRLANVRHADTIVVLEKGEVAEIGTHAELMAARGLYFELFSIQANAYAPGAEHGAPTGLGNSRST